MSANGLAEILLENHERGPINLLDDSPKVVREFLWNEEAVKAASDYEFMQAYRESRSLVQENLVTSGQVSDHAMKSKLLNCIVVRDVIDPSVVQLVSIENKNSQKISSSIYEKLLRGLSDEEQAKLKAAERFANPSFNPIEKSVFYAEENGALFYCFNSYKPPLWLKDHFWDGTPLDEGKLPEDHERFFKFLAGGSEGYAYLLNWVALSIRERNPTAICLLSQERSVGKSLFFEIMRSVHGSTNASSVRDSIFHRQFNGALKWKTLVLIDEVDLKGSGEAFNRLKALTNPRVEIEQKGRDAIEFTSYLNLVIASNDLQALPLNRDTRQFSVLDVPEERLDVAFPEWNTNPKIASALLDPEKIEQLALFLWHFPIDRQLLQYPYRGKKAESILALTTPEWQSLIDDWGLENPGKEITLKSLVTNIKEECRGHSLKQITVENYLKSKPTLFAVGRFNSTLQSHGKNTLIVKALNQVEFLTQESEM